MTKLTLTPTEQQFVDQLHTYNSNVSKETWLEIFKLIAATILIPFTTTEKSSVAIPFLGKLSKDGNFEPSRVLLDFIESPKTDRLQEVEEILIRAINMSLIDKLER